MSQNFNARGLENPFIFLLQPLRISEIEKVEAMKALREKRRDSCLGSHFLRETTLSARAKNSDIELGGKRGEAGAASLRGESKRASRDKEHAFFGSVVIARNLVVKRGAQVRRL